MSTTREIVARVFAGATDAALSVADRDHVVGRQRGRCFACDAVLGRAVIFGHLVPRSRGWPAPPL